MCKEEQVEHCPSPTEWPPAGHWSECLCPNNQKQTSWGWPQGATSCSVPCAHCPAPWSSIGICYRTPELACPPLAPWLFTDESRFTLSTCDRRERVWRSQGERYAACNIVQHDRFGGGSVMVPGVISMEGRTDLYRLENGSLTAIRYRDEILEPMVRPYAGAVGPGFLLMHDNARPHVARVCRQYLEDEGIDTIEWPSRSPDLNPIEHLWDIMFRSIRRRQVAPQTLQELTDALRQIWEDIPQDTIRRLIRSMPRRCQACIQARGGHTRYWEAFWVAEIEFWQNGLACHIIFSLDFRGVYTIKPSVGWKLLFPSKDVASFRS